MKNEHKAGAKSAPSTLPEYEMLQLIMEIANKYAIVRAVILQGSRANLKAPTDKMQDYDIVYLVEELEPLISDHSWVDQFGERLIMQMPETMTLPPPLNDGTFSYLMLFKDGNRIDLTLLPLTEWSRRGALDGLSIILMDKDRRFPNHPEPTESDYYVRRPTEKAFRDCCNEFWWTTTYVAKGLWRAEITYAKAMMERVVREMLDQMICWHIGAHYQFSVNPGKYGKYFRRYLSAERWRRLEKTYPDADPERIQEALWQMIALFEELALELAAELRFTYPSAEAQNVKVYLARLL